MSIRIGLPLVGLLVAGAGLAIWGLTPILMPVLTPEGELGERGAVSPDGRHKVPRARPSEWFYAQRAYPEAAIPHGDYLTALSRARELRAERAITGAGSWEEAGPSNIGGRITALAIHPSQPEVIYAGAANGGVVRTTDGGNSWTPLTDYLGSLSVGALAVAPDDPQTIYLGTGEANAAGDSSWSDL